MGSQRVGHEWATCTFFHYVYANPTLGLHLVSWLTQFAHYHSHLSITSLTWWLAQSLAFKGELTLYGHEWEKESNRANKKKCKTLWRTECVTRYNNIWECHYSKLLLNQNKEEQQPLNNVCSPITQGHIQKKWEGCTWEHSPDFSLYILRFVSLYTWTHTNVYSPLPPALLLISLSLQFQR